MCVSVCGSIFPWLASRGSNQIDKNHRPSQCTDTHTYTRTHKPTRTNTLTATKFQPASQPASQQQSENDQKSHFFIVSPWGTSQGRTIIQNFPAAIDGSASCGLPQGHRQAEAKPPLPAVVPVASGEGIGSGLCSSESRPAKNKQTNFVLRPSRDLARGC